MESFEKSQYLGLEIQKEKNLKVFSKIALIISLIGNAICVFGALMIGAKNILQKSFLPSLWLVY